MPVPAVHLCLVHNTPTSNVTPALDPGFQPREVILLHTRRQLFRAGNLASVLKPAGIAVSYWSVDDGRDIQHIRDRVLELLAEREHDDIALNASGGTRPMTLGAYEVFQELGKAVFYIDPDTDNLSWMHRRDLPGFNISERIALPAFLQAHGANLVSQGKKTGLARPLRNLGKELVTNADTLSKPLSALNWLASMAEEKLVSPELTRDQLGWYALNDLIERLQDENLLTLENKCLRFHNEAARFFVNGGWLEQYVFSVIYGMRSKVGRIQDIGHSLTLSRAGSGSAVSNELDVAFLANNRLYIIECKTRRFVGSAKSRDAAGTAALYKLDTLKSLLGGEQTRIMLVSFQALSTWDRRRAKDLGVSMCAAHQLPELHGIVERWILTDHGP